jgi:hypothetical protein
MINEAHNKQRIGVHINLNVRKLMLIVTCFVPFFSLISNKKAIDVDEWGTLWYKASLPKREKMLIDFFEYAFEPVAPNRRITLGRLKQLQKIMNSSQWNKDELKIKKALEKIVNDEVILIDAAIGMNLPEWCGTVPSEYLTGDNIAFLCTHRTFKVNGYSSFFVPFDPKKVKTGDSVFVVTNYLDLFFDVYHKEITEPYILVTNNSDFPVPAQFSRFLDDEKIIAWFCINPDDTKHSKLHPVPLGIRNHGYGREPINYMDSIITNNKSSSKKTLLYINFTLNHQERHDAIKAFKNKSWCTIISTKKDQTEYYKDVAKSKFVLSPRGDGLDCWRTWETLLLGSIPVVKSSGLDPVYAEFPIVVVNDWSEITEEFLEKKYDELSKKSFDYNKLFAPYWGYRINSFQNNK